MTDHAVRNVAGGETVELPPPGQRGRLDIHDGVLETIARRAAATASDTHHATGLSRLTSNDLPHAHLTVSAGHVVATLVVGAAWPTPAAGVAQRVRDVVTRKIVDLTGLTVTRVDVEVNFIPRDEHTNPRRVQ